MQTKIDYISLYSLYAILEKIKVHKKRIYIFSLNVNLMHEVNKNVNLLLQKEPRKAATSPPEGKKTWLFLSKFVNNFKRKKNREKIFKTQIQWYR